MKALLEKMMKNTIELTRTNIETAVGSSKIGGKPDLPRSFEWFRYNIDGESVPLSFIAQINLSEAAEYDKDGVLPKKGMLYFFYEFSSMTWGYDPKDAGSARVYLYEGDEELVRTEFPKDLSEEYFVPESAVKLSAKKCIPSYEELTDEISREGFAEYDDAAVELGFDPERDTEEIFKLLGYADIIQGDMRYECEAVSRGFYLGNAPKIDEETNREILAAQNEWVLLAQFGTLSDELMFGDCGSIYYYIRKDDLAEKRFDKAWLVLQCG